MMVQSRPMTDEDRQDLCNNVYVTPNSSNQLYISNAENQFAGFRSGNGQPVVIKTETLIGVKKFHDKWSIVADNEVKKFVDPNQPL